MTLDRRDVERIAHLARLKLSESEILQYAQGLSQIIELVNELGRVETEHVEPMAHPLPGQRARLRADVVTESDRHQRYQRNAPQVEASLYLVPRVIE
jgi:aspartyl-tRNA(Asn)/glutamyl-tRNA(Gln) amidotransferase subunit C